MKRKNCVGKRVMAAVLAVMTGFMIAPGSAITARAGEEIAEEVILETREEDYFEDGDILVEPEESGEATLQEEPVEESPAEEELIPEETPAETEDDSSFEENITYGDYEYSLSEDNAIIRSYSGNEADVVIPGEIDGHKVIEISYEAFKGNTAIETLVIPDTVTVLRNGAFKECTNLREVVLPDSITEIGDYAFYQCEKMTIPSKRLPESLKEIGFGAFWGTTSLTELTIPKGLTKVDRQVFLHSINTIYFEDGMTVIPANICNYADNITKVVIPKSVTELGASCFYTCSKLEHIELPSGLKLIDNWALGGCDKLDNVVIPDSVTELAKSVFEGCDSLKNIHLPKNLQAIGDRAFQDCKELEGVAIPKTVKSVGERAFSTCVKLRSIELPQGLETIGKEAFYKDEALEKITIPSTVTSMGADIFKGSVKAVEFAPGMTKIPDNACSGANNLTEVIIPEGIKTIGGKAFMNCKSLEELVVPESATTIGAKAFAGDRGLIVVIPATLENIGDKAFDDCIMAQKCGEDTRWELDLARNAAAVVGTGEVGVTEGNIFRSSVSKVKFLEIGEGITVISDRAFEGSENLMSVVMADTVRIIGKEAFKDCPKLQRVDFSAALETIEDKAFDGCSSINNVVFAGDAPQVNETAIPYEKIKAVYPAGAKGYDAAWKAQFSYWRWDTFNNTLPRKDIVLVLDNARPMNEYGRLANMKESATYFCEKLGGRLNNTRISIVDAGGYDYYYVKNSTDVIWEKEVINNFGIIPGNAYYEDGLSQAYHIIQESDSEYKAVIFFGAGDVGRYGNEESDQRDAYGYGQAFREIGCETYSLAVTPEEQGAACLILFAGDVNRVALINDIDRFTDIFAGNKLHADEDDDFVATFTDLADSPAEGLSFNSENGHYEAVFKGNAVTPKVMVSSSKGILKEGYDYTVKYSGNTKLNAKGKPATVTITGKGNYSGKQVLEFYLLKDESESPKEGSKAIKVKFKAAKHTYNGKPQKVSCKTDFEAGELAVTDAGTGKLLTVAEDFILTYSSNVKVGTAKVTVRGIGEYKGTVTKTFKITPDTTSEITALADTDTSVIYDPKGATPRLSVVANYGEETLTLREGADYVIKCKDNKNAGTGKCTVSFIGNFKGHAAVKDIPFTISPASFKMAELSVPNLGYTRPGKNRSTPVIVVDGVRVDKKDYDVKYYYAGEELTDKDKISLNLMSGEYMRKIDVVVTGKGNYEAGTLHGSYYVIWKIAAVNLSGAKIVAKEKNAKGKNVAIKSQQYTGKEIRPEVAVVITSGGRQVRIPSYMYEVKYLNNVKAGKATIIVTAKGDSTVGSCKTTFTIAAKKIN